MVIVVMLAVTTQRDITYVSRNADLQRRHLSKCINLRGWDSTIVEVWTYLEIK